MPGKGVVQRQCNKLNEERRVSVRSRVTFADFWASAHGNFVIEGGVDASRAQALVAKLGHEMAREGGATVVLTASTLVENALVSWVQQTGVGYLRVSSPRYPNYDYFYGWDDADITNYLLGVAQQQGLADQALVQFVAAFVDVLGRCYTPSLGSMRTLAGYDTAQIAQLGEVRGIASYHANTLRTAPASTVNALRYLLNWLASALPAASLASETKVNFSTEPLYANETYLVNISSSQPLAANAYFAHELDRALSTGTVARVVLADVPLTSAGPLASSLLGAQMRGAEVGVSLLNASRMFSIAESDLSALVFGTRVLLLDGGELSAGDLSVALQPLGTYQYHYPVLASPNVFGLDLLLPHGEWSVATTERLRVRPEDTIGCAGVFYGAEGRVVSLARSYS